MGATDLLRPEQSEVLTADFALPKAELAELVALLLQDDGRLMHFGCLAAQKARQWTEAALGRTMTAIISKVVAEAPRKST